jgi:hypothetical protein
MTVAGGPPGLGPRGLGAVRCAQLLTSLTDLPVSAADVGELERHGMLRASRRHRHRPLYRVADVHALADDPQAWEQIATVVAARQHRRLGRR